MRYGYEWKQRTREEKTTLVLEHMLAHEPYKKLLKDEYEDFRLCELDRLKREPTEDEMLEYIEKALQGDPNILVDMLTVELHRSHWQPDRIFLTELVSETVFHIDFALFTEKSYEWFTKQKEKETLALQR